MNTSLSTICELSTKLHKKKSNVIRAIDYVIFVPFSCNSCTVAAFLLEFIKHKRPHRRTIKTGYQAIKVGGNATSFSFLSVTVMATAPARQLNNKVCTRRDISSL